MTSCREFKEIESDWERPALTIATIPLKAVVTDRGLRAEFANQTSLRIEDLEPHYARLRKA